MPKHEGLERRALTPFEIRQEDGTVRVIGHAAVFNQETVIGDFFRETIAPGAFAEAIRNDDVPFLIEHSDLPLARTRSGTLILSEDSIGLRIESALDASDPDVQRIVPKMRRKDLDKMSFGFRAKKQEWIEEEGKLPLRVVRSVELLDVSIVTSPAYEGTDIAMRSLDAEREKAKAEAARAANDNADERTKNFLAASLRKRRQLQHDLAERARNFVRAVTGGITH